MEIDGSLSKRIITLVRTSRSFVMAFAKLNGEEHHYTYHVDGSVWETVGSDPAVLIGRSLPFEKFNGFYEFPGWGLSKSVVDQKEPKEIPRSGRRVKLGVE